MILNFNSKHILFLNKLLQLTMRAFIFLFCTLAFSFNPENGFSQDAIIQIKSNKMMSGKQIFKLINKQTDYKFIYRSNLLKDAPKLSVNQGKIRADQLLKSYLGPLKLTYELTQNNTVIVKKDLSNKSAARVQVPKEDEENDIQRIISGTIVDSDGVPLPGATVLESNTKNGTLTDFDGNFSIAVSGNDSILVISYLGFMSKEINVNNQTDLSITLEEDTVGLDEIIIVGYGSQRKADITGSVVRITPEKTRNLPNSNVLQAIQGRVAGLNITSGNSAGSSPDVLIRGANSLSASNSPLVVVDDVIYNGSVSDFNANDIESFNILKDASSTAVYGARAANGVLLITTKKGRSGKPKFKFNSYIGYQSAAKLIDLMDGAGYEQKIVDFNAANPTANVTLTAIEEANKASGTQTNWLDLITRSGIISNYELNVSGGTDRTTYYISGSIFDEEGIVKNDNFKRLNLNLNLNTKLTDWWSLAFNSSFINRNLSGRPASMYNAYSQSPYGNVFDENGPSGFARLPIGDQLGLNPFINTLVDEENKRTSLRGVVSSKIDIPFVKGLKWTMNYGGNIRNDRTNSFINNQLTASSMAQNGVAQKEHERNYDWTLDNILNYTNTIGEKHKIDVTLLYSRESREGDLTQARANDFVSQALGFNALALGAVQESLSRRDAQNSLSQMGRLNYVFDRKYAFTYTARRDGFSAFAENNKYAIFQAGAFAWTASNEAFLEDSKWLNYLKLRLSFGENGNQGINRFSSLSKINTSQYLFGDGGSSVSTFNIETLANSELSWESTASKNIGLDFQVLDNKISGSFDAYLSNTKDLLQLRSIPSITGFDQVLTNIGEVENKGFEFSINSRNYDNPNFGWDTNIVFSSSKNKIISLGGVDANADGIEDDDVANGWFIGQPIDAVFGFKTNGIYQLNDTDILSGFGPGDFRIVDKNDDGAITPADREILGRTSPNYIISLGNTLRYKGFSFYMLISSTQGGGENNAYIGDNYDTRSVNPRGFTTFTERFNVHNVPYWTASNPSNLYPRLDYVAPFDHPIIEDRSFVRIQDISLSYNFNEKVLNKIGFTSLQIFTSIKNAHTFTDWTGYNPETSTTVKGSPNLSSYTFGLNFGF